jgi:hypothetical protein
VNVPPEVTTIVLSFVAVGTADAPSASVRIDSDANIAGQQSANGQETGGEQLKRQGGAVLFYGRVRQPQF